jgi:hypothetical protein
MVQAMPELEDSERPPRAEPGVEEETGEAPYLDGG